MFLVSSYDVPIKNWSAVRLGQLCGVRAFPLYENIDILLKLIYSTLWKPTSEIDLIYEISKEVHL